MATSVFLILPAHCVAKNVGAISGGGQMVSKLQIGKLLQTSSKRLSVTTKNGEVG